MSPSRDSLRGGGTLPPRSGTPRTYYGSRPQAAPKKGHRTRNALIVLIAIVAVVFGVGWNPPHDTVHTFTSASDYNPSTESGCTNSGAGCHGSETSYQDFNKYHPNATCTTCHAFQGAACIPCHSPNTDHECQLCHDGSMKGAPDVVRLTDDYPTGHYRETSHTAMGDDWGAEMKTQAGAKAQAACSDCHSRDLRSAHTGIAAVAGSPYGSDIGCGECHNDVRSSGQAEIVAKWKSRTCEACHKVGSSAPMHPTDHAPEVLAVDSAGCASSGSGCHDTSDLHAIHADKPASCSGSAKKGEPGCHKLGTEALLPTTKTCGGAGKDSCHRVSADDTYHHKKLDTAHSPDSSVPASQVFDGVTCGECHLMAPDGTSLLDEHARPTSVQTVVPGDLCRNCHTAPASADAVAEKWPASGSADACDACHGRAGLAGVHDSDVSAVHTVAEGSSGCANSGAGCHPTANLASIGTPTTTSGLHATCLRCHALSASDGNGVYNPAKTTCGTGRDCHTGFDPATSAHEGSSSNDRAHTAGSAQRSATYVDLATGIRTPCGSCHQMKLGAEHDRPGSALSTAANACIACHNAQGSPSVVKGTWPQRTSARACFACHAESGEGGFHQGIDTAHAATELGPDGTPAPGSCVRYGCHGSLDLRELHAGLGCALPGCHSATGDPKGRDTTSCGGSNEFTSCHTGYTADEHFVSHDANLSGTVHGVTYSEGENEGCFGCHATDLVTEHARELAAGALTGTSANACRVCHADADDPGTGPLAGAAKVKAAIADRDMRCTTCHASGTSKNTGSAIASPHKDVATATPLPSGTVWSDPLGDWKTAFEAPTGGGHNDLSAPAVGAATGKRFPVTSFDIGGQTYTWALPPNTGSTTWLKASAFGLASLDTTEEIAHLSVHCSDCHAMPADMAGPHGESVHVGIDPAYSQTEYADPTRDQSQFTATGTDRVICLKCHDMAASTNPLVNPGGNPLHARHVMHDDLPTSDPHHYGEACIDCHVRIPHAWRRPRLLARTVETTDGATPDTYPYIPQGYDGLAGILLTNFATPNDLKSRYCATNGCHPAPSPTRHPLPSQIPTATYWP